MNRFIASSGAIVAVAGTLMYYLLEDLRRETFRQDLPPWLNLALVMIVAGLGVVVLSATLSPNFGALHPIGTLEASKYFGFAALFNTAAAVVFGAPILVPALEFPILLTEGPGIYIVLGYSWFVIFGVLGAFAWSSLFHSAQEIFSVRALDRRTFFLHLILSEVGIFGVSTFMFAGGYIGSRLAHDGAGYAVVGTAMEIAVVPSAVFIAVSLFSVVLGVSNLFLARRRH